MDVRRGHEEEAEQSRAALETALEEIRILTIDLHAERAQSKCQTDTDRAALNERDMLIDTLRRQMDQLTLEHQFQAESHVPLPPRTALDEMQVAIEQLESANSHLQGMVHALEQQVALRTAALQGALSEPSGLQRRLGQRVRHSLWLAGSFFRPWAFQPDLATPQTYRQAMGRLEALGQAMALLDQDGAADRIDACAYVQTLCLGLGDIVGQGLSIACSVDPDVPPWDVDQAITHGMIINELLADLARRYPANSAVPITIAVQMGRDGHLLISIAGPAVPPPVTAVPTGRRLLQTLVADLGGTMRSEQWPAQSTVVVLPPA